jgi:hypothetical protein
MRRRSAHPTVLFLGSRAGGLFRSQALLDAVQEFPRSPLGGQAQQDPFAASYQFLNELQPGASELHSHLTRFLREVTVSEADSCLAELIKLKLFSTIISTNIDGLLEQALENAGLRKPFDFDVVIPEQGHDPDFGFAEGRLYCRIIKPFGDLAARRYKMVRRNGYLDSEPQLKSFLENTLGADVLVVGLDVNWDREIVRAFLPKANSLWFVHDEDLTAAFAERLAAVW